MKTAGCPHLQVWFGPRELGPAHLQLPDASRLRLVSALHLRLVFGRFFKISHHHRDAARSLRSRELLRGVGARISRQPARRQHSLRRPRPSLSRSACRLGYSSGLPAVPASSFCTRSFPSRSWSCTSSPPRPRKRLPLPFSAESLQHFCSSPFFRHCSQLLPSTVSQRQSTAQSSSQPSCRPSRLRRLWLCAAPAVGCGCCCADAANFSAFSEPQMADAAEL